MKKPLLDIVLRVGMVAIATLGVLAYGVAWMVFEWPLRDLEKIQFVAASLTGLLFLVAIAIRGSE